MTFTFLCCTCMTLQPVLHLYDIATVLSHRAIGHLYDIGLYDIAARVSHRKIGGQEWPCVTLELCCHIGQLGACMTFNSICATLSYIKFNLDLNVIQKPYITSKLPCMTFV